MYTLTTYNWIIRCKIYKNKLHIKYNFLREKKPIIRQMSAKKCDFLILEIQQYVFWIFQLLSSSILSLQISISMPYLGRGRWKILAMTHCWIIRPEAPTQGIVPDTSSLRLLFGNDNSFVTGCVALTVIVSSFLDLLKKCFALFVLKKSSLKLDCLNEGDKVLMLSFGKGVGCRGRFDCVLDVDWSFW